VQNEIRITRNATDANNLVVAYNDAIGAASSPVGVSFSLDGGLTWSDRQLSVPTHPIVGSPDDGISLVFIFDPFIDSDSVGNVYAGYIATDGAGGGPSGLYIERSQDKGQTWSGPTTIAFDLRSTLVPPGAYRFNDRPDMTMDGSDGVYVVWIRDVGVGLATSDIHFTKSPPPGAPGPGNPTGLDFSGTVANSVAPQTVNDNPNGIDFANAPDVAVASDGTTYVAWINVDVTNPNPKPGTLLIDRSFDGGVSFGSDLTVQSITALALNLTTGVGATDALSGSYPSIAVNPSNPQMVYIVYAADPSGADEADIFFTRSSDGGVSWSAPIVVNDDGTTTDQFHPAIAVKPNGDIDIVWYDKRNSAGDDQWDVYLAASGDGGASFTSNLRVTDSSFTSPTDLSGAPWIGEYLGLEVDATTAAMAFTSGVGDARGDVFFDLFANPVNVAVTLTESADPIAAGSGAGNLTYVVTVANGGPANATGVTASLVMTVPQGVSIDSVTPSAGIWSSPTWTVGNLANGSSQSLTVVMTVGASTQTGTDIVSGTATVTAVNEPDVDPTNGSDTQSTSVVGPQQGQGIPVLGPPGMAVLVFLLAAAGVVGIARLKSLTSKSIGTASGGRHRR
jgi:hypothetical protein